MFHTGSGNFEDPKWIAFFVVITIIFVFGFIGNWATVISIWQKTSLHTPTFTAIGCLTLSDTFALASRYVSLLKGFYLGEMSSVLFSLVFTLSLSFYICSTLHIMLLSVMRYMLVVHPIRSLSLVTNKRIRCISGLIWIVTILGCIPYFIQLERAHRESHADYLLETIVSFIFATIPSMVIIGLHCAKLRAINGPLSELHPHQARRMSLLVGFILGFQVISTVPGLIHFAFRFIQEVDKSSYMKHSDWLSEFVLFVAVTMLANHAADPIFYFALTPTARRICRKQWKRTKSFYRKHSLSTDHSHTINTTV